MNTARKGAGQSGKRAKERLGQRAAGLKSGPRAGLGGRSGGADGAGTPLLQKPLSRSAMGRG